MFNRKAVQRARQGAAHLDTHRPGWWNEVTPKYLDIYSPNRCVLGQIYGNYTTGLWKLFGETRVILDSGKLMRDHGFLPEPSAGVSNQKLIKAWTREIEKRREYVEKQMQKKQHVLAA